MKDSRDARGGSAHDRAARVALSSVRLPLRKAASDAKSLAGRRGPLESVSPVFAEIETAGGP